MSVEYINPSFLVKKASGGCRLVTAFADVSLYSKPQPSLIPDVDSTLRSVRGIVADAVARLRISTHVYRLPAIAFLKKTRKNYVVLVFSSSRSSEERKRGISIR